MKKAITLLLLANLSLTGCDQLQSSGKPKYYGKIVFSDEIKDFDAYFDEHGEMTVEEKNLLTDIKTADGCWESALSIPTSSTEKGSEITVSSVYRKTQKEKEELALQKLASLPNMNSIRVFNLLNYPLKGDGILDGLSIGNYEEAGYSYSAYRAEQKIRYGKYCSI